MPEEPPQISGGSPPLEEVLADGELLRQVHRIIHEMDEPYKEVFTLKVFGDLSFKDISSLTCHIPQGTEENNRDVTEGELAMTDKRKDLPCTVVKDLLPLYHDGVVSSDTSDLIETHLEGCENCRYELNRELQK